MVNVCAMKTDDTYDVHAALATSLTTDDIF